MTETTPPYRRFRLVFALGILVVLASGGVFTQALLSWRAGLEGWRPGANVNLMRSSATTILLALSTILTLRAVRDPATSHRWRPYAGSYALLIVAIVLLVFTVRWTMRG